MKNKFDKIRVGNKDAKVLVTNFAYLSLLQVASYIFPLLTLPYLSTVIGVEGFGKIAFASAVMVWFVTISDWGFNYTATRDVAQNRDDKEKMSEIFSNVLWAKLLLMVISFLILLLTILTIPKFRENQLIILITFIMIPGKIMFPDWFFQALERMKYITILDVLSKLIFTIAVFVFIKEKQDFILQPLFISLGFVFSGFIAMYFILAKWKFKLKAPNISSIISTIKGSTDVFINNIMPNFYNSFTVLLLGFYGGNLSNGLLDGGSKFVNIMQQFMNIIARTFFPYLARKLNNHHIYVKINIYLSLTFSVFLFLFAPMIIKIFFTQEFYDSIVVLRIMSFSVFLISIRNTYGTHFMVLKGYEKELRNLIFIGALFGFIISFPLIYYYDFIGASITIILTQLTMAFLVVRKAKKISK